MRRDAELLAVDREVAQRLGQPVAGALQPAVQPVPQGPAPVAPQAAPRAAPVAPQAVPIAAAPVAPQAAPIAAAPVVPQAPTAVQPAPPAPQTVAAPPQAQTPQPTIAESVWDGNAMLVYSLLISVGLAAAFYLLLPPEKRKLFVGKPFSWAARVLALPVLVRVSFISLPLTGFLLDGCLWSAINGISIAIALGPVVLPPWLELAGVHVAFPTPGLRFAAVTLGSSSISGICLVFTVGDPSCSWLFLAPNCWSAVVSMLFGYAWLQAEGGGVMGVIAAGRSG